MNVLVTGGAGYIGSHAVQRLLRDGHSVVGVDNLFRGHAEAMELLKKDAGGRLHFVKADIGDRAAMEGLLRERWVETVMHFAALAYVGESVEQPLRYYRNNAAGALALIEACTAVGVNRFVFSSTCATYGEPAKEFVPIPEAIPHIKSGALRALAISTAQRVPQLPDLPTIAEAGLPGYAAISWQMVAAPSGTPRPILDRMAATISKLTADPAFRARVGEAGAEATGGTVDEARAFLKHETVKWRELLLKSGAKAD